LTAVKFSLINDPSNVIKPPASRLSGKLNFDDARMSLNGLSSFQWTYWSEIRQENSTGITELYYQGKYTQVNQAFHVIASIGREEGPAVQFLQVGPNRWIGDAEGETWIDENVAKLSGDSPFNYLAEPFSIWNLYKEVEKEGNMTNSTPILINGQNCNEYLFLGKRTNDKGELISLELKIYFNLETGLPVRVEGSSIKSGAYLHDIWDISHINDPNNTVNPPDD
jgi:hypothetical protein